jgi:hypothetical protein
MQGTGREVLARTRQVVGGARRVEAARRIVPCVHRIASPWDEGLRPAPGPGELSGFATRNCAIWPVVSGSGASPSGKGAGASFTSVSVCPSKPEKQRARRTARQAP